MTNLNVKKIQLIINIINKITIYQILINSIIIMNYLLFYLILTINHI
jgi:hypothetical protein